MDNEYRIYKEKVWEFLDNMAPGDAYLIENLSKPENREMFIACIKAYMDVTEPYQGWLSFNHDYSKIYKTDEITFKKEVPNKQNN
jgi:hypothetical protein